MNKVNNKIFICATEQSGDNIGKELLKKLILINPSMIIDGVGGSRMKPFMRKQFYSLKDFKSIGIIEILFSILKYLNMINLLSNLIIKNKYDLIITIDSPDFNFPLSKKIRKNGYKGKIIQVVAPTVWAWREYRAEKFSKVYDLILTLFSFENKFFEKFHLKTVTIGHPIYYIKNKNYNINKRNMIAFLPGSRMGEVQSLFNYFQLAYEELLKSQKKIKIFIPTLPHLEKYIKYKVKDWKIETLVLTEKKEVEKCFSKTKIALVCSGTATLEIAKRGIPQLIIYKLNIITEFILNFFVKIKFANILNIIENRIIIPEIVNSNLSKKNFLKLFYELLHDSKSNRKQLSDVKRILRKIEQKKPPFSIAFNEIKKYL